VGTGTVLFPKRRWTLQLQSAVA